MAPIPGTVSANGATYWDSDGWGWQPLWLSVDDIRLAAATRYGIRAVEPHYFAAGALNQTWRIGDHVMRVSRSARTPEQIRYEHDVLSRLHVRLPEVLAPVPGLDGRSLQPMESRASGGDRWLTVFPYVEGQLGAELPVASRVDQTAAFMARAHRTSLECIDLPQRPGCVAADDRSQWLWPRLAPMLKREVEGAADYFALFDEEDRYLTTWFNTLRRSGVELVRAVVQVDTNPRNMIFQGSEIAAVIDWDECRVDPLLAAVAREAYADEVDAASFWRTYLQSGGPLDPDSFDLMSGFARLNAFIDLMWADHGGHANPYSMNVIRTVADAVERMRGRVPLSAG